MAAPWSNRHWLRLYAALGTASALASWLLGLAAGRRVLLGLGLDGFAALLAGIPPGSAAVGLLLTPLVFGIGIGLLWKGTVEGRATTAVDGRIAGSRIRPIPGEPGPDYEVVSRVTYEIDGAVLFSEGAHAEVHGSEEAAREHRAGLQPGDPVQVYYRPGEPREIHLDAPPARTATLRAVGALITLMGGFAAFVGGVVLAG